MPKCCWNCAKAKIYHYPTKDPEFKKSCPVTGGVLLPASEDMLKKVWTGCMELTCFEPKENHA